MIVLLFVLAAWDERAAITVEGAGEVVLAQPSTGIGTAVDGVFGARVIVAPVIASRFRFLGVSLDLRLGTLGAKAADGTREVNVRSTDVRADVLLHLRWPIAFKNDVLRFVPALLVGPDFSIQSQQIVAPGTSLSRVAFVLGIGYGLRAALEGERWSVALNVLAVSQDARIPSLFIGLAAGYVFRL